MSAWALYWVLLWALFWAMTSWALFLVLFWVDFWGSKAYETFMLIEHKLAKLSRLHLGKLHFGNWRLKAVGHTDINKSDMTCRDNQEILSQLWHKFYEYLDLTHVTKQPPWYLLFLYRPVYFGLPGFLSNFGTCSISLIWSSVFLQTGWLYFSPPALISFVSLSGVYLGLPASK